MIQKISAFLLAGSIRETSHTHALVATIADRLLGRIHPVRSGLRSPSSYWVTYGLWLSFRAAPGIPLPLG
jgi:hypothetical protein